MIAFDALIRQSYEGQIQYGGIVEGETTYFANAKSVALDRDDILAQVPEFNETVVNASWARTMWFAVGDPANTD